MPHWHRTPQAVAILSRIKPDDLTPFRLTADQIRICHEQAALGWLEAALECFHQQHCYAHRPILGAANSLNTTGDRAWMAAWNASRTENMSEALAEWERVCGGERRMAA